MSAESRTFVDTNVLVYAHDLEAGSRQETARTLVRELWRERTGAISTQVLQEFYVTVTRKLPRPLDRPTARRLVAAYSRWYCHHLTPEDVLAAIVEGENATGQTATRSTRIPSALGGKNG